MLTKEAILKYLESPEELSPEELKRQVRVFIGVLSPKDKSALMVAQGPKRDYACEVEFLRQVGFTPLEASWYAGVGLDTSEIRRLVARRALTLKLSNRPYTAIAYDLIELEREVLKGMTDEQVLEELRK